MFVFVKKYPILLIAISFIVMMGFKGIEQSNMNNSKAVYNPQSEFIKLPEPKFNSNYSVEEALLNRRSVREFSEEALSLDEISQILWAAYGITEERSHPAFLRGGLRTAPSAGALYPLDIYLVAGYVKNLPAGIYKYIADGHKLELHASGDFREELAMAALKQDFVMDAPATLFYSAIFSRTTQKYGDRGKERYVCMDLGHSAENVYLQCASLGLGTCAIGAFTDDMISSVMMLSNKEVPLYLMPIGKRK